MKNDRYVGSAGLGELSKTPLIIGGIYVTDKKDENKERDDGVSAVASRRRRH